MLFFALLNNIGLVVSMDSGKPVKRVLPPEPKQDHYYIRQLEEHLRQSEIRILLQKIATINSSSNMHQGEKDLLKADAFVQLKRLGHRLSREELKQASFVGASFARSCISRYSSPTDK